MLWAHLCAWRWEGLRPEATRGQICIKYEERRTAGSCVHGALCPQPGGTPPALPAPEAELPAPFSVPEVGRTAKNASFWKAPLQTRAASKAGLQSLEQNQGIFQGEKISSGVSSWCTAKQCSGWVCLPALGCSGFVPQRPDARGQAGFAFPWHW